MDRAALEAALGAEFEADAADLRAVSRQARDLADAGVLEADLGHPLTVETVVRNLADAPDGYTLVERWNWWLGALDLSHGGYLRFQVREDIVRGDG